MYPAMAYGCVKAAAEIAPTDLSLHINVCSAVLEAVYCSRRYAGWNRAMIDSQNVPYGCCMGIPQNQRVSPVCPSPIDN